MRINRDPCWHHRHCSLLLAPRSPCTPPRRRCSSSEAAAPEHEALLPHRAWVRQGSARRSCPQGTHPGAGARSRLPVAGARRSCGGIGDLGAGIGGSALAAGSGLRGGGVLRGPLCLAASLRCRWPAVRAATARRAAARSRSLISVPSCPRLVFLAVVLITFRAPE